MKSKLKLSGRVSATMFAVGIGLALTCVFMLWWVDTTELAGEGAIIAGDTLTDLASLVALLVVIMSAPVVAGIVGIIEGVRTDQSGASLFVGVGCLFGAALLVVVGAFAISQVGSGGGGPEPLELLSVAGLAAIASGLGGGVGAAFSS